MSSNWWLAENKETSENKLSEPSQKVKSNNTNLAASNSVIRAIQMNFESLGGITKETNWGRVIENKNHSAPVNCMVFNQSVQAMSVTDTPLQSPIRESRVHDANSRRSSALAYTLEMVTVSPGVQIPKKKYIPRCIPKPSGVSPAGGGRPVLGRGSLLYSLTNQPEPSSAITDQQISNGAVETQSWSTFVSPYSPKIASHFEWRSNKGN